MLKGEKDTDGTLHKRATRQSYRDSIKFFFFVGRRLLKIFFLQPCVFI